jgi:hypothetical protein
MPNKFIYGTIQKYYRSLEPIWQTQKPDVLDSHLYLLGCWFFGWYAVKPTNQTILYLRREIKEDGSEQKNGEK